MLKCFRRIAISGHSARIQVIPVAALRSPDLAKWIEAEVAFPSTMVDRIVPATKDEHRALVQEKFGALANSSKSAAG